MRCDSSDPCLELIERLARLKVTPKQAVSTLGNFVEQARDILRYYGRLSAQPSGKDFEEPGHGEAAQE